MTRTLCEFWDVCVRALRGSGKTERTGLDDGSLTAALTGFGLVEEAPSS
jgi:hypothetical protein